MRSASSPESSPYMIRRQWKSVISRARGVSKIYKNNTSKDDELKNDVEAPKEAANYGVKSRKGYCISFYLPVKTDN